MLTICAFLRAWLQAIPCRAHCKLLPSSLKAHIDWLLQSKMLRPLLSIRLVKCNITCLPWLRDHITRGAGYPDLRMTWCGDYQKQSRVGGVSTEPSPTNNVTKWNEPRLWPTNTLQQSSGQQDLTSTRRGKHTTVPATRWSRSRPFMFLPGALLSTSP